MLMSAELPAEMMARMEAIAKRAEDAAKSATDAAGAGTAARAAAKDEGARQGWTDMPKELLDGIAAAASAMTVSALREEFEIQPPAADPTVPGSASAESGDATTSVMSGTSGSADTESSSSGISDPPPEGRKTLAQRMLGL
jgi:predicted NBD/HSP70 family sugar kinase